VTEPSGEAARDLLQTFNPTVPNVARIYDFLLLRHEALCYRAGVRDPRRRAVAAV
jgi:hypothetical protein